MMENLSDMLKGHEPKTDFTEKELDLPETKEETPPQGEPVPTIPITSFSKWFEQNSSKLQNVNQVKVAIRGVDPSKTLIIAIKDPEGGKDPAGNDKKILKVFEEADTIPVVNLPSSDMQIYSNGFKIVSKYNDDIVLKAYGIKTGLVITFCNEVDGKLIPYTIFRLKKREVEGDTTIPMFPKDPTDLIRKFAENADLQALQILYKQSVRAENLKTKKDVVDWLVKRQVEVTDVNHHLQIDSVIIDILK